MKDKILTNWFNGFNQRDWNSVSGIYAEDALVHSKKGPLRGGEGVVALAKKWTTAIPDAQITPLYTAEEDNGVFVVHWRCEGVMQGSIEEYVGTGKKITCHGLTCFRCCDQKVVEHWASIDYRPLRDC